MARILVGITTRNRPHYVREAVQSVLAQTMGDIRVIVSENPTTPEVSAQTAAWIASLGDARVSYQLQLIDGGEYGQGRYLISQCTEPYFCILHDDDRMEPDYLESALAVLEREEDVALYCSSLYLINGKGDRLPEPPGEFGAYCKIRDNYPEGRIASSLEPLLEFGLFSISGAVFRSSRITEYGLVDLDIGGIYPFEFNVFLRVAERRLPAWYSRRQLIAYRWHDTSMRQADGSILTRYMVEILVELLERRRFQGRAERLRRRLQAYNCRNLGCILLVAGEYRESLAILWKAVRLHPWGPTLWAYLIAAWVAPGLMRSRWQSRVNLSPPSPSWQEAIPAQARLSR